MVIKLYRNNSDERVLNKNIDNEQTFNNVDLIEPISILTPQLKMQSGSNILTTYNYVYIPIFSRYYYIEDMTCENGFVYIKCRVDVLMSHQDAIKECKCVVARNEEKFDRYLNDEKFICEQYQKQFVHKFNTPFTKVLNYILVVQGGGEI